MLPLLLAFTLALCEEPSTKETIKEDFKQAGRHVAEATEPPRTAIKKTFKKVGQAFKEGGKAVGKGAKDAGKAIGEGAKTAAKGVAKGTRETTEAIKDKVKE